MGRWRGFVGVVSLTGVAAGAATVTVTATNATGSATQTIDATVQPPAPTVAATLAAQAVAAGESTDMDMELPVWFVAVSAGSRNTCALGADGAVSCLGR